MNKLTFTHRLSLLLVYLQSVDLKVRRVHIHYPMLLSMEFGGIRPKNFKMMVMSDSNWMLNSFKKHLPQLRDEKLITYSNKPNDAGVIIELTRKGLREARKLESAVRL